MVVTQNHNRPVLTSELSCGIEADCRLSSPPNKEPVLGPAPLPEKGAPSPMPRVTPQGNQTGLRALPGSTVTVPGRTGRATGLRLQPDARVRGRFHRLILSCHRARKIGSLVMECSGKCQKLTAGSAIPLPRRRDQSAVLAWG